MLRLCFSVLLALLSSQAFCQKATPAIPSTQEAPETPATPFEIPPTIELKNGYFFFGSHEMREIYNDGGWDIQLTGTYPIWQWLQVYGSVEYLGRRGKSENMGQRTSIWVVPLSLGLQGVVTICPQVQYYVTLGPRYFFVHQNNHSSFVDRDISNNGCGGFANTGFHFIFWRHFLIDAFGEYSYKRMHFHPRKTNVVGSTVQVGGYTFGLGLGYAF